MSLTSPVHIKNSKLGSCPHGMPMGACPICNGMAGGNSTTKRDIPRNVGEMTYNQCAAIGAMLRAQRHAREQSKLSDINRLQTLLEFSKTLKKIQHKISEILIQLDKSIPTVLSKPLIFIVNNTIIRVLNTIIQMNNFIIKTVDSIFTKINDISNKIVSILGEIKMAITDRVSKFIAIIKKKFKNIFFITELDETEKDENKKKKIKESKHIFKFKEQLKKLFDKKESK